MIASLTMLETAGRECPAVILRCGLCDAERAVFAYDGEVPPMLRPALAALVERFEPESLPGSYTCDDCRSTPALVDAPAPGVDVDSGSFAE